MDIKLSARAEGDFTVVEVDGEIDLDSAPKLREVLTELASGDDCMLILDFERVMFLDSTGLGVLIGTLKRVRSRRGLLRLAGLRPNVMKVFRITKLTEVFSIYDTVDAALADVPGVVPA